RVVRAAEWPTARTDHRVLGTVSSSDAELACGGNAFVGERVGSWVSSLRDRGEASEVVVPTAAPGVCPRPRTAGVNEGELGAAADGTKADLDGCRAGRYANVLSVPAVGEDDATRRDELHEGADHTVTVVVRP